MIHLKKIIALTGLTGLYELIHAKSDGYIVKPLGATEPVFISSRKHPCAQIENIEVYTTEKNILLKDLFIAMKASAETLPNSNDLIAIKSYFKTVYPILDFERIYNNDFKKMIKWFHLIQENNIELAEPNV